MEKPLEAPRQFCKLNGGFGKRLASPDVTRDLRQEHVVDRAEEPLDLAAASGTSRPRVDQADLERDARLLDVLRNEVAAVVGIKLFGDAADGPVRILLAPDRLAQGERGVHGAWRCGGQEEAGDGPAVVVHHDGQPGADGLAGVEHEDIEHGMIGLPHLVGRIGVAPMHELVAVAIGRCVRRDGDACGFDPAHNPGHHRIACAGKAPRLCFRLDLAMDGCRSRAGAPGRHASHQGLDLGGEPSRDPGIAAPCPLQPCDALRPPGRKPAAQGSFRNAAFGRNAGQRNVLFQMKLQKPETRDGLRGGKAWS